MTRNDSEVDRTFARGQLDGLDTRGRLLEAGETLFSERGFQAASLRDLTRLAGVHLAAVSYHFGSKEGLLRAIVLRRGKPLREERERLLQQAELAAGRSAPAVASIITAFVEPVFRLGRDHPHFPALLGRVQAEKLLPVVGEALREVLEPSLERFATALERALPAIPRDELRLRLLLTVGTFHFLFLCREVIEAITGHSILAERERVCRSVIEFAVAGVCGPSAAEHRTGGAS